jgi:5-methylcytosine-specific restriction endonuclease McrA
MIGLTDGRVVHDECCKETVVNTTDEIQKEKDVLITRRENFINKLEKYKIKQQEWIERDNQNLQIYLSNQQYIKNKIKKLAKVIEESKENKSLIVNLIKDKKQKSRVKLPFISWVISLIKLSPLFIFYPKEKWPKRIYEDEQLLSHIIPLEKDLEQIKLGLSKNKNLIEHLEHELQELKIESIPQSNNLIETIEQTNIKIEEVDKDLEQLNLKPNTEQRYRLDLADYYDYWPDYPPDWKYRVGKIHNLMDGKCNICGILAPRGDVDHVKELFLNGSNKVDNLQLLCKKCHQNKHLHKLNKPDNFEKINLEFDPLTQRIREALSRNEEITIKYVKASGAVTDRRNIKPIKFIRAKVSGKLAIYAFCNLRNKEREFRLDRIEKIY